MAKAKSKAKKPMKAKSAKSKHVAKMKAKPVSKKAKTVAKPRLDLNSVKTLTEKQTKSQIISFVADHAGVKKSEVTQVFKALAVCVHSQMKKRSFGEIIIPETGIKVRRLRKPATKTRTMISPFTGQEITVQAKPARNVVKITALKSLKESVNE